MGRGWLFQELVPTMNKALADSFDSKFFVSGFCSESRNASRSKDSRLLIAWIMGAAAAL